VTRGEFCSLVSRHILNDAPKWGDQSQIFGRYSVLFQLFDLLVREIPLPQAPLRRLDQLVDVTGRTGSAVFTAFQKFDKLLFGCRKVWTVHL
jgi:hypothetical protein